MVRSLTAVFILASSLFTFLDLALDPEEEAASSGRLTGREQERDDEGLVMGWKMSDMMSSLGSASVWGITWLNVSGATSLFVF